MELKTLSMALSEADALDFEDTGRRKFFRKNVNPEYPPFVMPVKDAKPRPVDDYVHDDDIDPDEGRVYEYTFKDGVFYATPSNRMMASQFPLFYSVDYLKTWKVAKNDISRGENDDTMPRSGQNIPYVLQAIRRDFERAIAESLSAASSKVYYDDDGDLVIKPVDRSKPTFYMKREPDNRFYIMSDGEHKSEDDFWFSREFNKNGQPNADWHNVFMVLVMKVGNEYLDTVDVPGEFYKRNGELIQKKKSVLRTKAEFDKNKIRGLD